MVGAGPAGCVAALLLARLGARVALVEDPAATAGRATLGEVLPPAARAAFGRLGLDALLDDPTHAPSPGTLSAWGAGPPRTVDHARSPLGTGVQVVRDTLDLGLREAARGAGAVIVRVPRAAWGVVLPARVDRAAPRRGDAAPLAVVDASGRIAAVARSVGAHVERADRLVAIVGVLAPCRDAAQRVRAPDAERRVLVAAAVDGWWSSMVLPDGCRVAAFHTDADLPAARWRSDPAAWWSALQAAPLLGPLVVDGRWHAPDQVRVVAADSRRLRPAAGAAAVIPAGDAEMAFDPLSSFGIVGAISSAEEALSVVAAIMEGGPAVAAAIERREAAREHRWARYRSRLAAAYAEETRWPRSPFWSRRGAIDP